MCEIIEVEIESLKAVSSFFPTLCSLFSDFDFVSYVVKVDNAITYLFKQKKEGVFFLPNSSAYIRFTLNDK